MMEPIDFNECKCIVEYGPGTGVFTDEVVKRKRAATVFIVIEQNKEFFLRLKNRYYNVPNLILINGDASDVEQYLMDQNLSSADYIISGLPFTSLPGQVSDRILTATKRVIGEKGRFITFQYTLLKRKFFEQYFQIRGITLEFKNLPPAYVFTMKNR